MLALALACTREASREAELSPEVVARVPWGETEEARFVLLDEDGVEVGGGTLRVEAGADGYTLSQDFTAGENADRWSAAVAADTLLPSRVQRFLSDPNRGEATITVRYAGTFVEVVFEAGPDSRTEEAEVPSGAFDSLEEVFLVRAIPLAEGATVRYQSVTAALPDRLRPSVDVVTMVVKARETITVPAGTFEAWRVEIRGAGPDRTAWVADDGRHTLVRFDSGPFAYELVSVGS